MVDFYYIKEFISFTCVDRKRSHLTFSKITLWKRRRHKNMQQAIVRKVNDIGEKGSCARKNIRKFDLYPRILTEFA